MGGIGKEGLLCSKEKIVGNVEIGLYAHFVVRVRGHAHDACYADALKTTVLSRAHVFETFLRCEAKLGFLLCHMQL
jgi:hypothetical protein